MNRAPEKTLGDLLEEIRQAGAWMTAGIIVMGALAVLFIFMATPFYQAQMILSPARPMNGVEISLSSGGDNFFAERYLTQRNSSGSIDDFARFESMYAGPSVATKLLEDEKILRGLSFDKNFEFSESREKWTPEELAEYIKRRVKLQPVGATAMRRMVYLHPSREFGVYFLHRVHRVTDEMIRAAVRMEAGERIDYLQKTGETAVNPEHRRALTALLLEQEQLRMLASIDQPYAAAIIEPPANLPKAQWPDVLLLVPAFMFAVALAGFMLHGMRTARRQPDLLLFPTRRKSWFKGESTNNNERKLIRHP